jgi:hypothetical protein
MADFGSLAPKRRRQEEVRNYEPTLRESISQFLLGDIPAWDEPGAGGSRFVRDAIGRLTGTSSGIGKDIGAIDFVPGLGDAVAVDEAARSRDPLEIGLTGLGIAAAPLGLAIKTGVKGVKAAAKGAKAAPTHTPLKGLPTSVEVPGMGKVEFGPHGPAREAADRYMKNAGLKYSPPTDYVKANPEFAGRVARAFDEMKHAPNDPAVRKSYDALARETKAQWDEIEKTGLKIEFIKPGMDDPYKASPRLAHLDVKNNNHLWVYPTDSGFGSDAAFDAKDNPLLGMSGVTIDGKELRHNDLFRIVHDYFGHIKEGTGFRADGEENAYRIHSSMYSDEARPAMASETRGQNSWVNFGPHGEKNRTAKTEDTTFADQKIGLLPDWARGAPEDASDPVVALRKPDGKVLYGKPGQTHADLATEHNYFPNDSDQGFAKPGGPYMDRAEAMQTVKAERPDVIERYGPYANSGRLEARKYNKALPTPAPMSFAPERIVKPPRAKNDELVNIDVEKFDKNFSSQPDWYVGPQGTGKGAIPGRYERAGDFIKNNEKVNASEVHIAEDGTVGFTDGRHRYANFRDQGVKSLPMSLTPESAENARMHGYIVEDAPMLTPQETKWVEKGMTPEQAQIMTIQSTKSTKPKPSGEFIPFDNPIMAGDTRISTRYPHGPNRTADPLREHLKIGVDEMKKTDAFEHNANLIPSYPGFGNLRGLPPDEIARRYVDQTSGNLQHIYNRLPKEMQEWSPYWYYGANNLSDAHASRWGIPRQSSSASIAALSPQKDWFQNASLNERAGDIIFGPVSDKKMTGEMYDWARNAQTQSGPLFDDVDMKLISSLRGKSFNQLSDPTEQALWLRMYDEAHNPRQYREISPFGELGPVVMDADGKPKSVAWGSFDEIAKSIKLLQSGGDMDVISSTLSPGHKTRSFYNDIELPSEVARYGGDPVIDTHAVGAGQLRSVSQKDPAVVHNFGSSLQRKDQPLSWVPHSNAGFKPHGVKGTYGFLADSYRDASKALGLDPMQVQSPTWEGVRLRWPQEGKRGTMEAQSPDSIWGSYERGELSLDQAREAIFPAGSIGLPSWAQPGYGTLNPRSSSTYR